MDEPRDTRSAWVAIAVIALAVVALLAWQVDNPMILVWLLGIGLLGAGTLVWDRRA